MEDDLGEKLMIKFAGLQPKTCSNLTDDSDEDKKSKGKKKFAIKQKCSDIRKNFKIIKIVQKQINLKIK